MLGHHTHPTPPSTSPTSRQTPIHRLPAWLKFAAALTLIITSIAIPPHLALWLACPAALLLIITLLSRIPPLFLLKRLLLLEPFVLGVAAMALFQPHGTTLFLFLLARCTIALLTAILLGYTTPFSDLLHLFRTLHMPMLLITTLALMHRYLFVLADESARMRRARNSRTFTPRRRFAWHLTTTIIGQLFLRASNRAQRIYDAMRARGWEDAQ